MKRVWTNKKWSDSRRNTRHQKETRFRRQLDHALVLIQKVCGLAGDDRLIGNGRGDKIIRLRRAIEAHDTPYLFAQLLEAFSFQGISDHAAITYMDRNGRPAWSDLQRATRRTPVCSKLRCYWMFHDCGYQKAAQTCAEPEILSACRLPQLDLRNGRLNQTAYALFLFIRDVADGDLVAWIDSRIQQASLGSSTDRVRRRRLALTEPFRNLFGVSDKVAQMALAHLLTAAPASKRLWLETGASMIAIDTLVHNFLHRTGILRRFAAQHAYGPGCYAANGCADIIAAVASEIDAREFNPHYPRQFPRWVQHAIWRYCAQLELNICNGNRIDDRDRCGNKSCPLFDCCDRVALQPAAVTTG